VTNSSTFPEIGERPLNETVRKLPAEIESAFDRKDRTALWHVWSNEARHVGRVNARTLYPDKGPLGAPSETLSMLVSTVMPSSRPAVAAPNVTPLKVTE
jgi:hypothetical protein